MQKRSWRRLRSILLQKMPWLHFPECGLNSFLFSTLYTLKSFITICEYNWMYALHFKNIKKFKRCEFIHERYAALTSNRQKKNLFWFLLTILRIYDSHSLIHEMKHYKQHFLWLTYSTLSGTFFFDWIFDDCLFSLDIKKIMYEEINLFQIGWKHALPKTCESHGVFVTLKTCQTWVSLIFKTFYISLN